MSYGTASTETTMRLREVGLEDAYLVEPHNETVTIDIVIYGALDESFEIKAGYEEQVVDALVPMLKGNPEITDWELVAYVSGDESGDPPIYCRRSARS